MCIIGTPQQHYTFEDIEVGRCAEFDLVIDEQDVASFANLSGDFSELHMDEEFARRSRFRGRIVHGMLPLSAVSALVGMYLPGRHATLLALEADFRSPVRIGDRLQVSGKVLTKSASTRILKLQVVMTNQTTGQRVTEGKVEVLVDPPPKKGVMMAELNRLDLDLNFSDKTVLVTGASRGIGEATAKLFAQRGANVVVNYHVGQRDAEAIVSEIKQHGHQAIAVHADVTNRSEVDAMVHAAIRAFKRVDVLVNNAVRDATPTKFEELTWEAMQQDFDVVIKGAFNCCQAVIPSMLEQGGGSIINISTIFVESPIPHHVRYITSKSGLIGLTRALATEFAARNIRVNLVTPSITPTDLTAPLSDQTFKRLAEETPMKRTCQPLDVAKAIVMLASPYAQYTTGQQMMVTGGAPPFL